MKFLLILLIVLVVVWWWRNGRSDSSNQDEARKPAQAPTPEAEKPQAMVACRQCGLHVPRAEAVSGDQGLYCCAEHQRRAEP